MTLPAICHCGHPFEYHRDGATACALCTTCHGYAERTEVARNLHTLDTDDALDGERRRNNLPAAIELAQRPGQLHIEPGAELPHPCPHLWDDRAPDCHPWEHCCGYGTHCPRHDQKESA